MAINQGYNANYIELMVGASQTLKRGYFVNSRSGYIVEGADTSGDTFAGVVRTQEVVSDASRKYNDSKYGDTNDQAYVEVQKEGLFLAKVDHTSGTIYLNEKVYTKDGSVPSVESTTDSSNDVYCGKIECFVTGQTDLESTEDAYCTSDTWALIRIDTTD